MTNSNEERSGYYYYMPNVQNLHKNSIPHLCFPLMPPFLILDLQTPGINKQFGQGSTANMGIYSVITKSSLDSMESMYTSIATSQAQG